jgi:hypothetical protein
MDAGMPKTKQEIQKIPVNQSENNLKTFRSILFSHQGNFWL